ncbi:MAG: circadian clock KaiB family protein [Desulfatiglandales bacterium]
MDIPAVTHKEQEAPVQGLGLKLFITGEERPESARAVARFREMLQDYDLPASSVQVVDIERAPQTAKEAQVIGTPALVRESPFPKKSIIGDLSDATVVLQALDLPITKKRYAASVAESPKKLLIPGETGRTELKTVRVLMIAFDPVVQEELRTILTMDYGIALLPDAADADEALLQLKRASDQGRPIHIVLTETRTSTLDGIQATKLIKEQFPEVAVLVLTENLNDSYVIDAIHAGAGGYIFLKDMAPEELLQGIQRVVMGGIQMKRELLHTAVENLMAVKRGGARAAVQINHAGRYNFSMLNEGRQSVAPSAIQSRPTGEIPQPLSLTNILRVIDNFAQAALRDKRDALNYLT